MNGHIHGAKIQKNRNKNKKKCRALNTTNLAKAPHANSRQHGVDEEKNAVLGRMGASSTYPCPVYGGKPLLLQYGVALREVTAAEETPVGRQWRGMRSRQHIVPRAVDILRLTDGKTAPQHKHNARAPLRQCLNGGIGKEFPTTMLVRTGLMRPNRQRGIEQQHALLGPSGQVAARQRYLRTQVAVYLFDDIHQ